MTAGHFCLWNLYVTIYSYNDCRCTVAEHHSLSLTEEKISSNMEIPEENDEQNGPIRTRLTELGHLHLCTDNNRTAVKDSDS